MVVLSSICSQVSIYITQFVHVLCWASMCKDIGLWVRTDVVTFRLSHHAGKEHRCLSSYPSLHCHSLSVEVTPITQPGNIFTPHRYDRLATRKDVPVFATPSKRRFGRLSASLGLGSVAKTFPPNLQIPEPLPLECDSPPRSQKKK